LSGIKLSICIATYNRACFLGQTLESIMSQATSGMEMVIVDGASTDNTKEIVEEYTQRFPALRYYRMERKGGVDQDFCKAVELAEGDYCWLFSDDDIMKPGAIQAVFAEIERNYALIVVNAEVRNSDFSDILSERILKHKANRVYRTEESEDLFGETANYLSFIGAVVIRRDLWNAREKEKFFGTAFVHLGVIFQRPLDADALVIAEPYIIIRYGNAEWSSRSFEIWMFKYPELIWSFSYYSDSAKRKVYPRTPWLRPDRLLRYRASAHYSLKEYRERVAPLLRSPLHKWMAYGIACVPGFIANGLVALYAYVAGKKIVLFDLKSSPHYYKTYFKKQTRRLQKGS
jgi:abequosyltransferase